MATISQEEMRSDVHLVRIEITGLIEKNLECSSYLRNIKERYNFYLTSKKKKIVNQDYT